MQQRRRGAAAHVAMLDAKGSPFGNYDNVFIAIGQARWYYLLEIIASFSRAVPRLAHVPLHYDGRLRKWRRTRTSWRCVRSACQKAILDPAPFRRPTTWRHAWAWITVNVRGFHFFYD